MNSAAIIDHYQLNIKPFIYCRSYSLALAGTLPMTWLMFNILAASAIILIVYFNILK
jgi:hypothetical protein